MEKQEEKKRTSIKWIIVLVIVGILFLVAIPLLINAAYLKGSGFITAWNGAEFLAFYGAALSAIGAVFLGAISIWQNKKLREQNENIRKDNNEAQERIEIITTKANEITSLSLILQTESNRINKLSECMDEYIEICVTKNLPQKAKEIGNPSLTYALFTYDLTQLNRKIHLYCNLDYIFVTQKNELLVLVDNLRDNSLELYAYLEENDGRGNEELNRKIVESQKHLKNKWEEYLITTRVMINHIMLGEMTIDEIKLIYKNNLEVKNGQDEDAE